MSIRYGGPEKGITDAELGYAEVTSTQAFTTVKDAITGLEITINPRGRPYVVNAYMPQIIQKNTSALTNVFFSITDTAGTGLAQTCGILTTTPTNARIGLFASRRFPAASGTTVTYQARLQGVTAGSSFGSDVTTAIPAYIQAFEV